MFTQSRSPNQTMLMSSASATGTSIGITMNTISKKSRKKARKKTKTLTKNRKPTTPPGRPRSMCSIQRPPLTPWKTRLNTVAPIRMKSTIAVMRMVEVIACHIILLS